jgi:hypothetical protein
MLADLSVYFFIAELFVVSQGAGSQFVQFILLGLAYGVAVYMQSRTLNKLYFALPLAVLLTPGSYIPALLPPVIYILFLLYKEKTKLSWDRQCELFSMVIKFYPLAGISLCLLGKTADFVRYSLPMAFMSLATSVFLMRMLRQPPAVYLQPQYQRKNATMFAVVMGMAWLFSRDFVFRMAGSAMHFVYMKAIYPVLNGFILLFMGVLKLIMALFSWFKFGEVRLTENHLGGAEFRPTFKDSIITGDNVATTETFLTVLLAGVLLVAAFWFFRWLALHNGEENFISQGIDIIRGKENAKQKKERATTTVLQVRRQYRAFLKLYRQYGGKMETSTTSRDILDRSEHLLKTVPADMLAEMRQIYINARYRGTATKADLKRMKQINKELATKD